MGKMIVLDPWAIMLPSSSYDPVHHFIQRPPHSANRADSIAFATRAGQIGMRFNRMLGDGVCLYDVMQMVSPELFMSYPEGVVLGQIAVQAPSALDPFQYWEVEAKGTLEGTTEAGLVIRIPLVRFLRYRAVPVPIPPVVEPDVEPVVDNSVGVKLAEELYTHYGSN